MLVSTEVSTKPVLLDRLPGKGASVVEKMRGGGDAAAGRPRFVMMLTFLSLSHFDGIAAASITSYVSKVIGSRMPGVGTGDPCFLHDLFKVKGAAPRIRAPG